MRPIFITLALLFLLSACKQELVSESAIGGRITYNGESYNLKASRADYLGNFYQQTNSTHTIRFYAYASTINYTESNRSGGGAIIALEFNTPTDTIMPGIYQVDTQHSHETLSKDSSYLLILPQKLSNDTIFTSIADGYIMVETDPLGLKYTFKVRDHKGDSITGSYAGPVTYTRMIDGDSVGFLQIDTISYNLQHGNMIKWGPLFTETLNYYELYFYSTDLRLTDAGKIIKGLAFVVGIHTADAEEIPDGVYPVDRLFTKNTTLAGSKYGNATWGTYWNTFSNGKVLSRAFITQDSVEIVRRGDGYHIRFQLKDQTGKVLSGTYQSNFKITDMR